VRLSGLGFVRSDRPIMGIRMGSVSSSSEVSGPSCERQQSEQCGRYTPSVYANVNESRSCSCRRFNDEGGASSSMTLSPPPVTWHFDFPAPVMLPVTAGKDVWFGPFGKLG
jgi:hypothetical protein